MDVTIQKFIDRNDTFNQKFLVFTTSQCEYSVHLKQNLGIMTSSSESVEEYVSHDNMVSILVVTTSSLPVTIANKYHVKLYPSIKNVKGDLDNTEYDSISFVTYLYAQRLTFQKSVPDPHTQKNKHGDVAESSDTSRLTDSDPYSCDSRETTLIDLQDVLTRLESTEPTKHKYIVRQLGRQTKYTIYVYDKDEKVFVIYGDMTTLLATNLPDRFRPDHIIIVQSIQNDDNVYTKTAILYKRNIRNNRYIQVNSWPNNTIASTGSLDTYWVDITRKFIQYKTNAQKYIIFTSTNCNECINMKTILTMDLMEGHKVYTFKNNRVLVLVLTTSSTHLYPKHYNVRTSPDIKLVQKGVLECTKFNHTSFPVFLGVTSLSTTDYTTKANMISQLILTGTREHIVLHPVTDDVMITQLKRTHL